MNYGTASARRENAVITDLPRADMSLRHSSTGAANTALKAAAGFWFIVAAAGQLMFVAYLVLLYGAGAVQGHLEVLNKVMPRGYVPGDTLGNGAIVAHVFLAAIITVGGIVQLVPQIRSRWPVLHRWNGRVYLTAVLATSIAGLYMTWFRSTTGDFSQHLGITLDAMLILLCAAMALRHALARNFTVHRRWALRLFFVSNAVWFFRVGLMFWIVVNHGPAGFDPRTFTGPFLTFLSFADSLLPLAVLELYLRTQQRAGTAGRIAMTGGLVVASIATGIGIAVASMALWLPYMRG